MAAALVDRPLHATVVLHTLTYHQVTKFPSPGAAALNHSLVVSADGRKIAFARPSYGGPSRSNLTYVVNFDGSGLALLDQYAVFDTYPKVDIGADGSRILSWDGYGAVRLVNGDGGNAHQVIQINGGYQDFRLAPDGSAVFFSVDRGFGTTPDTGSHGPGLYVVQADGTGLRQISSRTNWAALFGLEEGDLIPEGYLYGWNGGTPFGLSGDGTKLIFYLWTPSQIRLLGMDTTGGGLHELPLGSKPIRVNEVGLNGDGSTAFYYLAYDSGEELGVLDWTGSNKRILLSLSSGGFGVANLIQLSRDGSKLLFGESGLLINTDGSGLLQLDWSARFAANHLLQNGLYRGVMDASATRFGYLTPAGALDNSLQVATAEFNPVNPGLAPAISNASAAPPYIVINGPSPVFSAGVTPTNGLIAGGGAQAGILLAGRADPATWQGSSLHDDGQGGDAIANDSVYSDNTSHYAGNPTLGLRTVRFKAELLGGDGLYHATAVDVAPFFVLTEAPNTPPPSINSITPTTGPAGTQVTISGLGFGPTTTNIFVSFGNVPGVVVSVNPAGTEIVVLVPEGLPSDSVPLTASSGGQTSLPSAFGLGGGSPNSLEIKLLAGLDIHGTVGTTYRIDYLRDVTDTNSWVTLTNIVLTKDPLFWVDLSSVDEAKRFYRTVRAP